MILSVALLIASQVAAQPVNVPIQNPSFEMGDFSHLGQCGYRTYSYAPSVVPGWKFSLPTQFATGGFVQWSCGPIPDGTSVAFLQGAGMSQNLGVNAQAGVYTLQFYVANWFYPYPGRYTASISIGPVVECPISGWATGDFVKVTAVCPVPGYLIEGGSDPQTLGGFTDDHTLTISFSHDKGWPVIIDNVSLTFTPQS